MRRCRTLLLTAAEAALIRVKALAEVTADARGPRRSRTVDRHSRAAVHTGGRGDTRPTDDRVEARDGLVVDQVVDVLLAKFPHVVRRDSGFGRQQGDVIVGIVFPGGAAGDQELEESRWTAQEV